MNDLAREKIGERIAQRMRELGLNDVEVAEYVGVSKVATGKWRKGEAEPSGSNLLKLAQKLETRIEWLATGEGEISAEHTSQSSTQDYEPSTSTIEFMETLKEMERNGELTPQVIGLLNNTLNTVKSLSGQRLSVSHLVEMPE